MKSGTVQCSQPVFLDEANTFSVVHSRFICILFMCTKSTFAQGVIGYSTQSFVLGPRKHYTNLIWLIHWFLEFC